MAASGSPPTRTSVAATVGPSGESMLTVDASTGSPDCSAAATEPAQASALMIGIFILSFSQPLTGVEPRLAAAEPVRQNHAGSWMARRGSARPPPDVARDEHPAQRARRGAGADGP